MASAQFPPSRTGYARVAGCLAAEFTRAGHEVMPLTEHRGCERVGRVHRLTSEGRRVILSGADVIQVVGPSPLFTEQVLAQSRTRGIPCVYKADAFPGLATYYPGSIARTIDAVYERTVLARAMRFASWGVYSTRDFAELVHPRPDSWSVIPLGVTDPCLATGHLDLDEMKEDEAPTFGILFVGQLRAYKGVQVLLDASRRVLDQGFSHRLTILGDGPLRESLEARAAELGLSSTTRFVSAPSDVELHTAYLRNDVLVLPSLSAESYGLVLVEAALHGMSVVTTDLPGAREVALELGGSVVPRGEPVALADTLAGLVARGRIRHALDLQVASTHAWPAIAHRYLDLYGRVLGN